MENKRIKFAILSIASLLMISMTAPVILTDIKQHFSDVEESVIQMVLTLPALFGLIFAFLSGPLSIWITKKNLVLFSLINGLIGGLMSLLQYLLVLESAVLCRVVFF
nr:hypothetical protein [uncultured Acetobacterium sp.]